MEEPHRSAPDEDGLEHSRGSSPESVPAKSDLDAKDFSDVDLDLAQSRHGDNDHSTSENDNSTPENIAVEASNFPNTKSFPGETLPVDTVALQTPDSVNDKPFALQQTLDYMQGSELEHSQSPPVQEPLDEVEADENQPSPEALVQPPVLATGTDDTPFSTGTETDAFTSVAISPKLGSPIGAADVEQWPGRVTNDSVQLEPSQSHVEAKAANSTETSNESILRGILMVGFDHALGPVIEFSHPPELRHDEALSTQLPFFALPDGAHMHDEDCCYFHLYAPSLSSTTVFGISCNRQISSEELLHRGAEVTRSTVQKAIVVLTTKPLFGPIRDKLVVITRALFAQRDFEKTDLLVDFYSSLSSSLMDPEQLNDAALYMGTSVRELIYRFRHKTLVLVKLLLLQKRVMFYGALVEQLCTFQYSLISLIPLLLPNLDDAASSELDTRAVSAERPTELRTSDRKSLLNFIGFPLDIFGLDALFQPYMPLQQLESLSAKTWLVGTTNKIFQQQRDCHIDVLVNLDNATIEFMDPSIASSVNLTAPDRKYIDEITTTVLDSWNPDDPTRPVNMRFEGSDDYLRGKFEEYLCSALATVKYADSLSQGSQGKIITSGTGGPESSPPNTGLLSFNELWINEFRRTKAGALWEKVTDPLVFDLVEPRHPCEGQTRMVEDVGIRLSQGVRDLRIDENLAPTRDAIAKGFASGTETMWGLMANVRSDLAKKQNEYKEWREQKHQQQPNNSQTSPSPVLASTPPSPENTSTPKRDSGVKPLQLRGGRASTGTGTPPPTSAATSTAASGATALASSVGSFFSQKRTQFWGPPDPKE